MSFGPIIIMGVSGCGKTSVSERLADYLGVLSVDADRLHPAANVRKMQMGLPLDDEDRKPWLETVGRELAKGGDVTVACSALKRSYRDILRQSAGRPVTFIFLQGDRMLLSARMTARSGHFMPPSLLDSQLATLELPNGEPDVVTIDIDQSIGSILTTALTLLTARRIAQSNLKDGGQV